MSGRLNMNMLGWLTLLVVCRWALVLAQPLTPTETVHGSEAIASFPRQPGHDWVRESDSDGITVYSRKPEGSSIREVLAESLISAPLARVLEAIEDYRSYPEFMPYVEESAVWEEGEGKKRLFLQLGFPPPISDRYYTIVMHRTPDPLDAAAVFVLWDAARDALPGKTGRGIEVTVNRGGWRLRPGVGAGETRVLYYVHTDPGGSLPAWAVNLANTVAVPKIIMRLKERVRAHAFN